MRNPRSKRFESMAHFTIVSLLTVSLTSNVMLFLPNIEFGASRHGILFGLLAAAAWLILCFTTIVLNIAGSIHRRFSLCAMLASLLALVFSSARPLIT